MKYSAMKTQGLPKRLGVIEAIGLGIGAMIGGTIYAGSGIAMRITEGAADVAFLLAAIVASLAAYSYAKLCTILPDSGGSYSIVNGILGEKAGLLICLCQLLAYITASSFYAYMAAEYVELFVNLDKILIALILLLIITLLNLCGAKESGLVELIISSVKILVLVVIIAKASQLITPSLPQVKTSPLRLLEAASLLFLGFEGFEVIASASGELVNPERDAKLAIFASLTIVSLIYIFIAILSRSMSAYNEYTLLAALGERALGSAGVMSVTASAVLSAFTALNANMFVVSRLLYALGRDGVIPSIFSVTGRRGIPILAIITSAILSGLLIIFGSLRLLLGLANLMFFVIFIAVSIAAFEAGFRSVPLLAIITLSIFALFSLRNVVFLPH
ncbi:MAG: hypothetical protein DRJ18_02465 [Candidatus Methanomethylicota archaeon]|nr:MAG: hypothetical protein DRJ18_02465 [Candidatus Verstraetearchaeota archaeon]